MKYIGLYKDPQDIATKANVDAVADRVTTAEGEIDALQTAVDGKQDTVTGGASTIVDSNLTADRALISNSSGKVAASAVTSTELGYLDGVTSAIQTQLNAKVPNTRKVNNKALSADITLTASDVGALPDTTVIPTIPDNLVQYTAISAVQDVDTLNADTLEGHSASYFATAAGLSSTNTQVTTNTNNISTLTSGLSTANSNITTLQNNKLNKSGGTMTGALVAQSNTNYTTAQVRNVIISTADPSGGSSGMIWIKYTP